MVKTIIIIIMALTVVITVISLIICKLDLFLVHYQFEYTVYPAI